MNNNEITNSYQVVAIYSIPVQNMPHIIRCDRHLVKLSHNAEWMKVNAITPSTLEISSRIENKNKLYSAKLVFNILDKFYEEGRYTYLVVQANGIKRLVGTDSRPYPTATTTQKTTAADNASEQIEVTIEYTSSQEIAVLV